VRCRSGKTGNDRSLAKSNRLFVFCFDASFFQRSTWVKPEVASYEIVSLNEKEETDTALRRFAEANRQEGWRRYVMCNALNTVKHASFTVY
jgi:hypothetical protein